MDGFCRLGWERNDRRCNRVERLDNEPSDYPYLTTVQALGVCMHHVRRRGWVLFELGHTQL